MHADELAIDLALVKRLLADQFPAWAELPIERVEPSGTDNAIYRLGTDMAIRLPRQRSSAAVPAEEFRWLPILEHGVEFTYLEKGHLTVRCVGLDAR
jgi:aminoglycoside phosphotransferase (APT) family kinase protein